MIDEKFNWRVPKSWNELPTDMLERITPLTLEYNLMLASGDRLAEPQYKLKVLLLTCGLEDKCMTEFDGDRDWYYFRVMCQRENRCTLRLVNGVKQWLGRRLWSIEKDPWNLYVKVPVEVLSYLTNEHMKWVDDPYTRLKAPYEFILVDGEKYKGPSDKMTSVTYQQYQTAQNLVTRYWQIQENLRWLLENNGSQEAVLQNGNALDQVRKTFLACLFCPGCIVTEVTKNGQKIEVRRETWEYDPIQLENADKFDRATCDRVFPVMLQFFFSVQQYYSKIFPDLFVKREDNGTQQQRPDFMLQEVETMSAIMKYQGFADYQAIYDSNTVHILKVLDNMAHEAKEMKKLTTH